MHSKHYTTQSPNPKQKPVTRDENPYLNSIKNENKYLQPNHNQSLNSSQINVPNSARKMLPPFQQQQQQPSQQNLQQQYQSQPQTQLNAIEPQLCLFHPNQIITNFCREKQCLMPLCPECITSHLQMHQNSGQFANIESIEKTTQDCYNVVSQIEQSYHLDLQNLQNFKEKKQNMAQFMQQKLDTARQKVFQIVENFFDNLQNDYSQYLQCEKESNLAELQNAEIFMAQKYHEITSMKQKLGTQKYMKYLVRILNTDYQGENLHYHKECEQFLEIMEKKTLDLLTDDTKLYNFNLELAKYITIKNAEQYAHLKNSNNNTIQQQQKPQPLYEQKNIYLKQNQTQNYPIENLANQFQFQNNISQQHNIQQQQQQNHNNSNSMNPSPVNERYDQRIQNQTHEDIIYQDGFKPVKMKTTLQNDGTIQFSNQQKKDPFSKSSNLQKNQPNQLRPSIQQLNFQDYFQDRAAQKLLHYFSTQSNQFSFLNLNNLQQQQQQNKAQWISIDLDLENPVEIGHRSLITPHGHVYVTGGYNKNGQATKNTYLLNPNSKSLEKLVEMKIGRSEHGFLYLNNSLYVLGGKDHNGKSILEQCERLDLESIENNRNTAEWKEISALKNGVQDFSYCTFKNKYIMVFGKNYQNENIVQLYDPRFDTWRIVNIDILDSNLYFDLRKFSGAQQINEDSILIFGGQDYNIEENKSINFQQQQQQKKRNHFNYILTLISNQNQMVEKSALRFVAEYSKDFIASNKTTNTQTIESQIIFHNNQICASVTNNNNNNNQNQEKNIIIYNGNQWMEL